MRVYYFTNWDLFHTFKHNNLTVEKLNNYLLIHLGKSVINSTDTEKAFHKNLTLIFVLKIIIKIRTDWYFLVQYASIIFNGTTLEAFKQNDTTNRFSDSIVIIFY